MAGGDFLVATSAAVFAALIVLRASADVVADLEQKHQARIREHQRRLAAAQADADPGEDAIVVYAVSDESTSCDSTS